MKFALEVTLPARIDTTRSDGDDTPFVRAVLGVDGVASVFGVNDFVTVMRDPDADWNTIACRVDAAAAAHLPDGPGDPPAEDEVALARKLLRDAVVPPKPNGRDPAGTCVRSRPQRLASHFDEMSGDPLWSPADGALHA